MKTISALAFALIVGSCGCAHAQETTSPLEPLQDIAKTITDAISPIVALQKQPARRAHPVRHVRHGNAEPAVRAAAKAAGVPESIAVKAASIESGNTCAPGGHHYGGPLQILYSSARALGFRGKPSELNSCGAGLRYGMAHLAMCFRLAHGNPVKTIRCHQAGPAVLSH